MKLKYRNFIHIVLLVVFAGIINEVNPNIANLDLFKLEKIFELNLVLLGVGISLITFLYSILVSLRNELTAKFSSINENDFLKILKSINLNIRRMVLSLVLLIIMIIIKDLNMPFLNLTNCGIDLLAIIKLSIFFYIMASIIDVILSTLKLYELAFNLK